MTCATEGRRQGGVGGFSSTRIAIVAGGLSLAVLTTACSSRTTGTPVPQPMASSGVSTSQYDPCLLDRDVLRSAGLDPDNPLGPYSAGAGRSTENGCRWAGPGGTQASFSSTLGKSARTVDEYLVNPTFDSSPTSVAGRKAVNFRTGAADVCNLAIEISGGSAIVVVSPVAGELSREQACARAERIATAIASKLP